MLKKVKVKQLIAGALSVITMLGSTSAFATDWITVGYNPGGTGNPGVFTEVMPRNGQSAWKTFISDPDLYRYAHDSGNVESWFQRVAFGGSALAIEQCRNSDHVFIHTGPSGTTANGTKQGILTNAGHNGHVPRDLQYGYQKKGNDIWNEFMDGKLASKIGNNTIIVCSGALGVSEPKPDLLFRTISKTFEYDGTPKTATDWEHASGNLKAGHKLNMAAFSQRTDRGTQPIPFTKWFEILDSSGNKVNHEYNINRKLGTLRIVAQPPPPPTTGERRCIDPTDFSTTAYVRNSISGAHQYTPSGAPSLATVQEHRDTHAGKHAKNVPFPSPGQTEASLVSWINTFQSQNPDEETPELNLEALGVAKTLSKYGGVYNVTRTLRQDNYKATTCQPQTRHRVRTWSTCTDSEGNSYSCSSWSWSPWTNSGPREVESSSGPHAQPPEIFSYQILSVNCNKEGFDRVRAEEGGTVISLGAGDAGAVLQTPEYTGANQGVLGKGGHETATDTFYYEGKSCDVFKCSSDKLEGASHDGDRNLTVDPSFTQDKGDGEHGEAIGKGQDGQVVFFRDNEDRNVRADVWYPLNPTPSDLIIDPKDAAKKTYAKVYGGTPEWNITTIAPWNQENRKIGSINPSSEQGTDANWSGSINNFLVKSQWSSENEKPYELGVNWEYEGEAQNIAPATIDGYKITGMTSPYTYKFDVYCEFHNVPGSSQQANIPISPIKDGKVKEHWDWTNAVRVFFTRSVSDTHNRGQ